MDVPLKSNMSESDWLRVWDNYVDFWASFYKNWGRAVFSKRISEMKFTPYRFMDFIK